MDRGETRGQGRSQKSARTLMVIRILKKKYSAPIKKIFEQIPKERQKPDKRKNVGI